MFPRPVAEQLRSHRAYHNERLAAYCLDGGIPLVDLATVLRDEHFADELHPNDGGAQVIAQEVFLVFSEVKKLDGLG
jgi:hypothetical protein